MPLLGFELTVCGDFSEIPEPTTEVPSILWVIPDALKFIYGKVWETVITRVATSECTLNLGLLQLQSS